MTFMKLNLKYEKKPDGKKIMYKNGVLVNQNQKGNNNNNINNINQDNDPYGFNQMSYEQAFGIKKK